MLRKHPHSYRFLALAVIAVVAVAVGRQWTGGGGNTRVHGDGRDVRAQVTGDSGSGDMSLEAIRNAIVPHPKSVAKLSDALLDVTTSWAVAADLGNADDAFTVQELREELWGNGSAVPDTAYAPVDVSIINPKQMRITIGNPKENAGVAAAAAAEGIDIDAELADDRFNEGYVLLVKPADIFHPATVLILARSTAGTYYGMVSLSWLLNLSPQRGSGAAITLPHAKITDWPDMKIRAFYGGGSFSWKGDTIDTATEAGQLRWITILANHKYNLWMAGLPRLSPDPAPADIAALLEREDDLRKRHMYTALTATPQSVVGFDPNLYEGAWARDVPATAGEDGVVRTFPRDIGIRNAGFDEDADGNGVPDGWTASATLDDPASTWTVDTREYHSGGASARLAQAADLSGSTKSSSILVSLPHPERGAEEGRYYDLEAGKVYELSVWAKKDAAHEAGQTQLTCVLESDDPDYGIFTKSVAFEANGNAWQRYRVMFSSEKVTRMYVYARAQGTGPLALWIDDLTVTNVSDRLVNVIENASTRLHVRSADGSVEYEEGTDYDVVRTGALHAGDPLMGKTMAITARGGGRIAGGAALSLEYDFLPRMQGDRTESMSLADPAVLAAYRDDVIGPTLAHVRPDVVFIGMDEVRGFNRDSRSRALGLPNHELMARFLNGIMDAVHALAPQATVLLWDDMVSPYHNGGTETYQLPFGGQPGKSWHALTALKNTGMAFLDWWFTPTDAAGKIANAPSLYTQLGFPFLGGPSADNTAIDMWSYQVYKYAALGMSEQEFSGDAGGVAHAAERSWNAVKSYPSLTDPPVFKGVPRTLEATEGGLVTFTATATSSDGTAILSGTALPARATFVSTGGVGTFGWKTQPGDAGTHIVTVTAMDARGHFIPWDVLLTILPDATLPVTLEVAAEHGTVTKNPDRPSYARGTVVALTATPDPGYDFSGWWGDLRGKGSTAAIVMDGNKSVIALFAEDDTGGSGGDVTGNMLANGGMEGACTAFPSGDEAPPSWELYGAAAGGRTCDTTEQHGGSSSWKFTSAGTRYALSEFIPASPHTWYKGGAWIKGLEEGKRAYFSLWEYDADKQRIGSTTFPTNFYTPTAWTSVQALLRTSTGASFVRLLLTGNYDTSHTTWFDDVSLVRLPDGPDAMLPPAGPLDTASARSIDFGPVPAVSAGAAYTESAVGPGGSTGGTTFQPLLPRSRLVVQFPAFNVDADGLPLSPFLLEVRYRDTVDAALSTVNTTDHRASVGSRVDFIPDDPLVPNTRAWLPVALGLGRNADGKWLVGQAAFAPSAFPLLRARDGMFSFSISMPDVIAEDAALQLPLDYITLRAITQEEYGAFFGEARGRQGYYEVPLPADQSGETFTEPYVVFKRDEMAAVSPRTQPSRAELVDRLSTFTAPGEIEPLSVALYSHGGVSNLSFTLSDLQSAEGGTIPASALSLRRVMYDEKLAREYPKRGYALMPDRLEPFDTLSLAARTTALLWLHVHVPSDAAPGTYRGEVRVSDGRVLPLRLTVLPLTLDHSRAVNAVYHDPFLKPISLDTAESFRFYREYGLDPFYYDTKITPIKDAQGAVTGFDTTQLALRLDRMVEEGFLKDRAIFQPNNWGSIYRAVYGVSAGSTAATLWDDLSRPEFVAAFGAYIRKVIELGDARGVQWYFSVADEPGVNPELRITCDRLYTVIRANGGKTAVTSYSSLAQVLSGSALGAYQVPGGAVPSLFPLLDVPVLAMRETSYRDRIPGGKGYYTTYFSNLRYPVYNRFLHGLGAFSFDATIVSAYAMSDFIMDPLNDFDVNPKREKKLYPDFVLAYPTWKGGLQPLMAAEGIREGIKDARYLATLQRLLQEHPGHPAAGAARTLLADLRARITPDPWSHTVTARQDGYYEEILKDVSPTGDPGDFAAFTAVRRQLAGGILRIQGNHWLAEKASVPSTTNTSTPSYTFHALYGGAITYGGSCTSATARAESGDNTITFSTLTEGAHDDCTITVTDDEGITSDTVAVGSFTVMGGEGGSSSSVSMGESGGGGVAGGSRRARSRTLRAAYGVLSAAADISRWAMHQVVVAVQQAPAALDSAATKVRATFTGNLPLVVRQGGFMVFLDVASTSSIAPDVRYLAAQGVISGFRSAEGLFLRLFKPRQNLTYGEAAKVAIEAARIRTLSGESPSTRSARGHWSQAYVATLEKRGSPVFSDSSLDVSTPIPRSSFLRLLMEAFSVREDADTLTDDEILAFAKKNKWMDGVPFFRESPPQAPLRRRDAVGIVRKVMEAYGRKGETVHAAAPKESIVRRLLKRLGL